jgi:hypothetical protein
MGVRFATVLRRIAQPSEHSSERFAGREVSPSGGRFKQKPCNACEGDPTVALGGIPGCLTSRRPLVGVEYRPLRIRRVCMIRP